MSVLKDFNGRFNLLGRLALTAAVGTAAIVSLYFVSGSVKAVQDIDRTDDTLAELLGTLRRGTRRSVDSWQRLDRQPTPRWQPSRRPWIAASRGFRR